MVSSQQASTALPADPQAAGHLVLLGNALGTVGVVLGFVRLPDGGAEAITPVALVAVWFLGVVSFVRHSIFHRSDTARMKWDIGRTDNFRTSHRACSPSPVAWAWGWRHRPP